MTRTTLTGLLAALAPLAAALIGSSWQVASHHGVTTTLGPPELAVLRYGVPAIVVFRRSGLKPWHGAELVNTWSAVLLLPLLAVMGAPKLLTVPWVDVAFQAAGQGVLAGLLGLVTYMAAIARLGAAKASLSAALAPLMTALGAVWLLGEPLGAGTLPAGAAVAFGVLLASGVVSRRA